MNLDWLPLLIITIAICIYIYRGRKKTPCEHHLESETDSAGIHYCPNC